MVKLSWVTIMEDSETTFTGTEIKSGGLFGNGALDVDTVDGGLAWVIILIPIQRLLILSQFLHCQMVVKQIFF